VTTDLADALDRLGVLIGKWKTEGLTTEVPGAPPQRIDAVDTYERLPGGALLHLVDARVGGVKVEGAEIIGFDSGRRTYATQFFGGDDATSYEATLTEEGGDLVWTMVSERNRFRGTFNSERDFITGHWDAVGDDSEWQSWMDITLTKQPG
jgi:hypothetical protein